MRTSEDPQLYVVEEIDCSRGREEGRLGTGRSVLVFPVLGSIGWLPFCLLLLLLSYHVWLGLPLCRKKGSRRNHSLPTSHRLVDFAFENIKSLGGVEYKRPGIL